MKVLRITSVLFMGSVVGCSAGDDASTVFVSPGTGLLGDACSKSEDCASTVCVDLGSGKGICSLACDNVSECPAIDNWGCVTSTSSVMNVCACRKLSEREVCGDALDNDCDGKADDCRTCGGLVVANDDPNHCGSCGNACNLGKVCHDGKCSCTKEAPNDCGGCTNTQVDALNCGSCGNACGTGQKCVAGKCECPAGDASTYCPGVGCVDKTRSNDHCGSCGNVCTLGRTCKDGSCACSTDSTEFCEGVGCVDRKTDAKNCGTCGNVCSSGKLCKDGACTCSDVTALCGDSCVDTQTNVAHCGGCDKACGAAQACVGGVCGCSQFGRSVCGDTCADLQTDVLHCGSCDKACAKGERCSGGTCSCDSALYCEGVCMQANDANNCGDCGRACGTGQACSSGTCVCQGSGLSVCNGACVSIQTDVANCGKCGNACLPGQSCRLGVCQCASTTQTYCAESSVCDYLSSSANNCGTCGNACHSGEYCSAGACRCSTTGQSYCEQAGGCVSLTSNNSNCGTCGNACPTGQSCVSGVCRCPYTTQTYCAASGTCVYLSSDSSSCGTCGNACRTGEYCSSGTCRCSGTGQQYCASASSCIDTLSDSRNCGACDKTCPAETTCSSGVCRCNQSGAALCGESCFDLQTDKANCGSCGKACTGNYTCAAGKCTCPVPVTGTPVRITNNSIDERKPAVAWDGTHVGVAYAQSIGGSMSYFQIRFAVLNADGTLVSDTPLTSYTMNSVYYGAVSAPQIVWNGSEYALTWIEYTGTRQLVFLRLDATGAPKGAPVTVGPASTLASQSINAHNLAWSENYKGYAVVFGNSNEFAFRRIGADAATLETPNILTQGLAYTVSRQPQIIAAPDGTWGVAGGTYSEVMFALYNADGSRTLAPSILSNGVESSWALWPSMVRDSRTWVTAWVGSTMRDIIVNRGTVANSPTSIVSAASPAIINSVKMAMAGTTLAVGWTERASSMTAAYRYRLQRFSLPEATTSAPTAVHAPIDVLSTYNISANDDVALVATGTSGLLAVWADDRWGAAREIYASPIDLQNCPDTDSGVSK